MSFFKKDSFSVLLIWVLLTWMMNHSKWFHILWMKRNEWAFWKCLLNISAIKKVNVRNKVFKRLNNDLINVFVRKFKFNYHESSKAKVKSFRVIHKISFKTAQLSRDLDLFINHDFLSIRFKCSKNDWLNVISINRVLSSRKLFIF